MAQATTPTTRRPDRARRSVLDRLLGTSGAELTALTEIPQFCSSNLPTLGRSAA